jgi:uncharacterized protein YukE
MTDIAIGYDGLNRTAQQLKQGREELAAELNRLQSLIRELTDGQFKTQFASAKLRETFEQWTTNTQGMIASLDTFSGFLHSVVQGHTALDNQLGPG